MRTNDDAPRRTDRWAWAAGGVLLAAELLIDKHGEVAIEHVFGFHGLVGLAAAAALVGLARVLRPRPTQSAGDDHER